MALVLDVAKLVAGREDYYVLRGNLLFAAASAQGLVSITSVLASLYPIFTVVLARLVLHERVARSQEAGIALTLGGVALIAAG